MKNVFLLGAVAAFGATVWLVSNAAAQQKPATSPAKTTAPNASLQQVAEAAIREAVEEFIAAFDRGDAEALTQHFTQEGVYIDEEGQRFEGQKSIQQEYTMLFDKHSNLRLQLEIDSIRLVNPTTAIEEGRAAMTPQPPGANRVMSRYIAIYTRQDGKWLMAHVRDTRVEMPPDYGQLEDLGWCVGTWTTAGKDARVEVKMRWLESHHFLARSHSVIESGKVTSTGLQIIGLDPSTGQITSWSFTGDGGLAVGRWAPYDNGWIVESIGVMSDGTPTRATDILTRKDKDTIVRTSHERFAGETPLPDAQAVTLKRNPSPK